MGLLGVRVGQESEGAPHHPTADCLTGVHPSREHDGLLVLGAALRSHRDEGHIDPAQALGEHRLHGVLASQGTLVDCKEVPSEIAEGVGDCVAKVDCVVVVREGVGEGEGVEVLCEDVVFADAVLEVSEVGASLVPALALLGELLRVNADLHAVVEHAVLLGVVLHVELDAVTLLRVAHSEEEPLSVALRVDVVLHEQVVLLVGQLLSQEQVA